MRKQDTAVGNSICGLVHWIFHFFNMNLLQKLLSKKVKGQINANITMNEEVVYYH